MDDREAPEIIPDEPVRECPICKDWTLFRYNHCPTCGFDLSDREAIDPDEFMHPENY